MCAGGAGRRRAFLRSIGGSIEHRSNSAGGGPLAERAITSGPSLIRLYPAAEFQAVAAGSVEDWSRQSWEISRDYAYASAFGGDARDHVHIQRN